MTRPRLISGAALLVGLGLFGCGPSVNPNASARVSGSLTYKGQPVKGAHMQFHPPSGQAFEAQVSPDGTYQATDIAPGELVVTIDTEPFKSMGGGSAKEGEKRKDTMSPAPPGRGSNVDNPAPEAVYMKIPAKYASSKTSPTTVTLKPGRQVINIELAD